MYGALTIQEGKIKNHVSAYQPSTAVKELTKTVKADAEGGDEILNRPYDEFNGLSFVERGNEDQKNWLSWMPEPSDDPEDAWRWYGTRPITRNKIISTASHLTAQLIKPAIFAQNNDDEEDRDAAEVASALLDYNIQHSNYELTFVYGVISGLVNPVSYFQVDYNQNYMEILEGSSSNKFEKKKVLDDETSGFQHSLVPFDEVLFANPYEFNFQKQRFIMRSKRVSYHELETIYGEHPNWLHVTVGVKAVLGDDNVFYNVEDINDEMCGLLEPMYRTKDFQCCFINGIYFGDDNTEYNPMLHRTAKNKPKYNMVKYGAEPVDAMRFYGYKSLAAKMANDQALVDRQWNLAMDGSFLDTMEPTVTIGAGKIDKSVMVPATVTDLPANSQVVTGLRRGNSQAAFNALHEAERSMSESSLDVQLQGQAGAASKTARGAILEQQNAETNLGMMSRMIGTMAVEVGKLKLDDIIRYQTVGEVDEILGGIPKLKYKTFLLEQQKEGRNKATIIRFTDKYDNEMDENDTRDAKMELAEEAGEDREIYMVNPALFSKLDFLLTFDYEQMTKRNTAFERAFKLEIYDRSITNPYVNQEGITRDFLLEPLMKGNASKYMRDSEEVMKQVIPMGNGQSSQPQQSTSSLAQNVVESAATRDMMPV